MCLACDMLHKEQAAQNTASIISTFLVTSDEDKLTFVLRFLQASHATNVLEPRRRALDVDEVGAEDAAVDEDEEAREYAEASEGILIRSL
ncbi:hypothetical protein H2198_001150 [Neophaeococcomyces mojaviensis]|uniref:Uncharacterized protein n=1 Tax=Neophaeococcomyces mojaviensis TaxID=3383035 RepID=A0ACC3AHW7_9EURO|nr:hypothetical protein H2198_001150 [Knufia sp. JES_112]